MKTTFIQILFLLILIAMTSCNKIDVPEPDPVVSEPVFFSKMSLDGNQIDLVAGKNKYVMDAKFKRNNGIISFIGTIRPEACLTARCRQSIQFLIKDLRRFSSSNFNASESLSAPELSYAWQFRSDSSLVTFRSLPSTNANVHPKWNFDGARQIEQIGDAPRAIFSHRKKYMVSLETRHGQCISSQKQTIDLPQGGCACEIKRNDRVLIAKAKGHPPFAYEWSNQSTDSILRVSSIAADLKTISLKVTDATGCVSYSEIGRFADGDNQICATSFIYKKELLATRDKNQFGLALIRYVSADGIVYDSNIRSQPKDAIFRIVSVSDFEENDLGQKTKKITLEFSCLLYNAKDDTNKRLRGRSVFAVAFPD